MKNQRSKKQNLKSNIEKKVLSFELWFFAFRFKFLVNLYMYHIIISNLIKLFHHPLNI